MGHVAGDKKAVTPEEVKSFVQNNLVYINHQAGEIEWVDKNGNNMEEGFDQDVYEAINKAVLVERETEEIIY